MMSFIKEGYGHDDEQSPFIKVDQPSKESRKSLQQSIAQKTATFHSRLLWTHILLILTYTAICLSIIHSYQKPVSDQRTPGPSFHQQFPE